MIALMTLTFSLSAAGQKEASETGPVTIEFWTHEDPNRDAIENRYVEEFMTANPDVTVNRVTHSSKKIFELVLTAFAANAGPDIFNMQIEQAYSYIVLMKELPPWIIWLPGYIDADDMVDKYHGRISGFCYCRRRSLRYSPGTE